jgi:hypothetical protein
VVSEALTNTIRYARATELRVDLDVTGGWLVVLDADPVALTCLIGDGATGEAMLTVASSRSSCVAARSPVSTSSTSASVDEKT